MPASKIMVIRHAEKPVGKTKGVELNGSTDPESLIVLGWQRAGALVGLFDSSDETSRLAAPQHLFAAKFERAKGSKRPFETIDPLSQKLQIAIDDSFKKSDYAAMAAAAIACNGVVLIAWEHQRIPAIGNAIVGNKRTVPQKWPGDRFDIVWVFTAKPGGGYAFTQVPQMLLAGDKSSVIKK